MTIPVDVDQFLSVPCLWLTGHITLGNVRNTLNISELSFVPIELFNMNHIEWIDIPLKGGLINTFNNIPHNRRVNWRNIFIKKHPFNDKYVDVMTKYINGKLLYNPYSTK